MIKDTGCGVFDGAAIKDGTKPEVNKIEEDDSGLASDVDYNCAISCKVSLCDEDGKGGFCDTPTECSATVYLMYARQGSEQVILQVISGGEICGGDEEAY